MAGWGRQSYRWEHQPIFGEISPKLHETEKNWTKRRVRVPGASPAGSTNAKKIIMFEIYCENYERKIIFPSLALFYLIRSHIIET